LRSLRERFVSLGYTDEGVREALATSPASENTERLADLWAEGYERRRKSTEIGSAAEALVQLFLLEGTLSMSACHALLGPRPTAALVDAGILTSEGSWVAAEVVLVPWRGLWLLADAFAHRLARDAVFIPDTSSYAVSALLPPGRGKRAVDVGTGCGILALEQADSFEQVIAVDVNPRSVAFARFNAVVNDRPLVVERGTPDALGPASPFVGDVDLITFVLPFVFSEMDGAESTALVSPHGAALLEQTYRTVDAILADGGTALLWHQVPLRPDGCFERMLVQWGIIPRNRIVLNLAAMSEELELGVAVVRRSCAADDLAIRRVDRNASGRLTWADLAA
jgi:SAM-dependent methyltransferase